MLELERRRSKASLPGGPGTLPAETARLGSRLGGDQGDDALAGTLAALTAAFGDPTRRAVFLWLRSHPEETASAVAEHFGLHPNVARHHLDKLVAGGWLEVVQRPAREAAKGRPSRRYSVAARELGLEVLSRRDELLVALLAELLTLADPEAAELAAERVGERFGKSLAAATGWERARRSFPQVVAAIAEALTANGFAARTESTGRSVTFVTQHCPFGQAALDAPVLCAVDRGIVRGMLRELSGAEVPVTLRSRARGDDTCATVV